MTEAYNDGSSFNVTATFSGDFAHGTVTDSQGGSGTYTYDNTTVKFTLVFPDVTYEYTGTFSDANTMSGTCKRYQTSANVINGTWTATRSTSSVAAFGNTTNSNKGKIRPQIGSWGEACGLAPAGLHPQAEFETRPGRAAFRGLSSAGEVEELVSGTSSL